MRYLLPNKKQYKVNLHAHSNISDGELSPLEIKELYKKNGYSAVAFTDHDVLMTHNDLSDDSFIALNGYELKINEGGVEHAGYKYKSYHMNLIAKDDSIDTQVCFNPDRITDEARRFIPFVKHDGIYNEEYSADGVNDIINRAHAAGFLIHYNHPVWCRNTYADLTGIHGFDGVELINTGSIVTMQLPEDTDSVYAGFLERGEFPYPLACDDNHNQHGTSDSFGAFNMVFCDSLSYQSIIDALQEQSTYASAGPIIKALWAENGIVHIETENTVCVHFLTATRKAKRVYDETGLDMASFRVDGDYGYVRIVLTDKDGNHAYTRAYGVDEIL